MDIKFISIIMTERILAYIMTDRISIVTHKSLKKNIKSCEKVDE